LYCPIIRLLFLFHLGEAFAAINGTILFGLERYFAGLAARRANRIEHFPCTSVVPARIAAGFAALGLVSEALFLIEILLTGGEHELFAAFFAY
jgi:hypothetical protein